MRMIMHVKLPVEKFNAAVADGTLGAKLDHIMSETKPEHVFFSEYEGRRGAIMIVNVAEPSRVPALAEPWFLLFDANVSFHIVMSPDDLAKAHLDVIAKKWL